MIEKFLKDIPILVEKIKESHKILILPHANPDGDAMGSVLAFSHLLRKMGKEIAMYATPQIPAFLKWLPDAQNVIEINSTNSHTISDSIFSDFDLILGLDWSIGNRLKILSNAFKEAKCYKIFIDHHPNPEQDADLILVEPEYVSTAEFLFDIISNSEFFRFSTKLVQLAFTAE